MTTHSNRLRNIAVFILSTLNEKRVAGKLSRITVLVSSILFWHGWAEAQNPAPLNRAIAEAYPTLEPLYRYLHENPELSFHEQNTAQRLAAELGARGFIVTTGVGGYGVVAVLENGDGPRLLIRSDMDALPLVENTGLSYASRVRTQNADGKVVGVMHACGHDIHMTSLIGVADAMQQMRQHWSGTLVLIGQPAEEYGAGARAMLEDGLFQRFPLPDYALAFHVAGDLEAGTIGYRTGFSMANVDSVDIAVQGKGGHGAAPHTAIDPVVIASQIVIALQTIVSREIDPTDSAVVTVGTIQAGSKRNIIPDDALLQLTVRSYSDSTRRKIIESIERIAANIARAAGVPDNQLPSVTIKDEYTPALYNDPELTERLAAAWKNALGKDRVSIRSPEMIGEDFARYGRTDEQVPICMFRVGVAKPTPTGIASQSLHSPEFSPDVEPTLKTAVFAMTTAALELLQPPEHGENPRPQEE